MSSAVRSYAIRKEGLTTFIKFDTPCYRDSILDYNILFPFTYSNGMLDISYVANRFKEEMVDTLNEDPRGGARTAVRIMGGPQLVSSLGENFKAYIRAWRDGSIDVGSPINIHIAPQVIRVQEADYAYINAIHGDSYSLSSQPPSGDTYTIGNDANQYRATYVFKTPMTISIVVSGVVQYITFRTIMDQE